MPWAIACCTAFFREKNFLDGLPCTSSPWELAWRITQASIPKCHAQIRKIKLALVQIRKVHQSIGRTSTERLYSFWQNKCRTFVRFTHLCTICSPPSSVIPFPEGYFEACSQRPDWKIQPACCLLCDRTSWPLLIPYDWHKVTMLCDGRGIMVQIPPPFGGILKGIGTLLESRFGNICAFPP